MTTQIAGGFIQLKQNLEITSLQAQTVSTRQQRVRQAVSNSLSVINSFLTGSYSRSTMIAPLCQADIDIFMIVDPTYFKQDGQAWLLDKTKTAVFNTYKAGTKISRNGQAVTLRFSDFIVDVVPAFNRVGGGYLIPDSVNNRWIETDPSFHVRYTSDQNKWHNGDLVPLIKMIKAWNREAGLPFRSFYLEMLIISILKNITITDYPTGMRYFFDKARGAVKYMLRDPFEFGGNINAFNSISTVAEAISRLETAYQQSFNACNYSNQGYTSYAFIEWRKVFGNYFPSFG